MSDKLYIQMFSVHGLLRYENMELGRDADTGGQIKYVVEIAEELSKNEDVERIDLFTRLLSDKKVSSDYSRPIETISDKFRIVRIQCGGKKYIRKELLWPHLDEFVDKTIKFIKREGRTPDIVHGHYADGGYIAQILSEYFETPFIFTGHSLGHPKKQKLLNEEMTPESINKIYKIETRIGNEEEILKNADLVITSTHQEIEMQYGMYENRDLARYKVIPPGINLERFYPFYHQTPPSSKDGSYDEERLQANAFITEELNRFFIQSGKPLILTLCRPDKRKNINGLIDAYGQDKELQAMANLAIFAGIRKDITTMPDNEKDVLTQMLLLMDKYDLYGKMAIPKRHDSTHEVPELYRIAAEKRGVFVNVALTEPFGLTLIESSACGLPTVATNDGGPRDILENCQNGVLVNPTDPTEISEAIRAIIVDHDKWKEYSLNGIKGVNEHYTWSAHASHYLDEVKHLKQVKREVMADESIKNPVGDRLTKLNYFVITDIDNTLVGDDEALEELMAVVNENRSKIGFGVATGRMIDSALEVLDEYGIKPDVVISSVGSEIYYRDQSFPDKGWQSHISKEWNREKIKQVLSNIDYLIYQEEETQRDYKLSYYMEPKKDRFAEVNHILLQNKCRCNIIYSHNQFLDILPHRASKGKAIRYLCYKWDIDLQKVVVCGDSGNDEEMLRGSMLAVVVGNYAEELEKLRGLNRIYFSEKEYAYGILDGLRHYNLIERSKK